MSDSWKTVHTEITRIESLLNNNIFPIRLVEKEVDKFVSSHVENIINERKDKMYVFL